MALSYITHTFRLLIIIQPTIMITESNLKIWWFFYLFIFFGRMKGVTFLFVLRASCLECTIKLLSALKSLGIVLFFVIMPLSIPLSSLFNLFLLRVCLLILFYNYIKYQVLMAVPTLPALFPLSNI